MGIILGSFYAFIMFIEFTCGFTDIETGEDKDFNCLGCSRSWCWCCCCMSKYSRRRESIDLTDELDDDDYYRVNRDKAYEDFAKGL